MKKIVIPITKGEIVLNFSQNEKLEWECILTNEAFTDITQFISSGYYSLDCTKNIEVD
jgi:hypothetical protein